MLRSTSATVGQPTTSVTYAVFDLGVGLFSDIMGRWVMCSTRVHERRNLQTCG